MKIRCPIYLVYYPLSAFVLLFAAGCLTVNISIMGSQRNKTDSTPFYKSPSPLTEAGRDAAIDIENQPGGIAEGATIQTPDMPVPYSIPDGIIPDSKTDTTGVDNGEVPPVDNPVDNSPEAVNPGVDDQPAPVNVKVDGLPGEETTELLDAVVVDDKILFIADGINSWPTKDDDGKTLYGMGYLGRPGQTPKKFEWIGPDGNKARDWVRWDPNIPKGYNHHTVPQSGEKCVFLLVSVDGKQRTNALEITWP